MQFGGIGGYSGGMALNFESCTSQLDLTGWLRRKEEDIEFE